MNHAEHDLPVEAITAVELSAEDLIDLSRAPEREMPAQRTGPAEYEPADANESRSSPMLAFTQRLFSASRQRLPGFAAGVLGLGIVASIAMGAHYAGVHYRSGASEPAMPTPVLAWTPIPERAEHVEVLDEPSAPPTLFVNPFDEAEVFELPSNISQEEARQIVAELLMERARQRARR